MSAWRTKAEIHILTLLKEGENALHTADGTMALKDAFIVLTNRRLFIFRMGTWRRSEPKYYEIWLQHIMAAECERGFPPILIIHSRTGIYGIKLPLGQARREAAMWPNWILEAQATAPSHP